MPQGTQLSDVLPLVVQHCPSISIQKDLCSLLQVSSGCRQQLQWSRGHCQLTNALVMQSSGEEDEEDEKGYKQKSFLRAVKQQQAMGRWLVQHAGLVSHLDLQDCSFSTRQLQVLIRMWSDTLRLCRLLAAHHSTSAAVGRAGSAGVAALTPAAAPALQLQLQSAKLHFLPSPLLLQELAAAGLQELEIGVGPAPPTGAAACAARFSCLTSLRKFTLLSAFDVQLQLPWQHLTQLTALEPGPLDPATALQLPNSLQTLQAVFEPGLGGSNGSDGSDGSDSSDGDGGSCTVFDLGHLTALGSLVWHQHERSPPSAARLPLSLTALTMWGGLRSISGGEGLQQVELRTLHNPGALLLQQLSHLSKPWSLTLHAIDGYSLYGCAEAAAVGAATALTRLNLNWWNLGAALADDVKWCAKLRKLSNLRVLLMHAPLQREDLLHLSAITTLHELCFWNSSAKDSLDDFVAASLAASLTGLTALSLSNNNITNVNLLPKLALLTGLQRLNIIGGSGFRVGDEELMALSRLTQLSELQLLCTDDEGYVLDKHWTPDGEIRFLQGMPHLHRINM